MIVAYLHCPECKNILASTLFTKIIYYKGNIKLINIVGSTCVYCKKDYLSSKSLEEVQFEIDMFEDEIDRKE